MTPVLALAALLALLRKEPERAHASGAQATTAEKLRRNLALAAYERSMHRGERPAMAVWKAQTLYASKGGSDIAFKARLAALDPERYRR